MTPRAPMPVRERTLARVWAAVRSPGPPPPGVIAFTTLFVGGTAVLVALLIFLGIRDHQKAAWHFYEARIGTYISAALLIASAALAAWIASRLAGRSLARFWLAVAVGFVYLTWDELALVHEGLDKWIHRQIGWPHNHPVTTQLDAVIIVLYGVAAAWWGFRYRHALLRLRWATRLLAIAFVGFVVMAALDMIGGTTAAEESMKLMTEALIAAGFFAAARDPVLAEVA